ncbi:hypothetical protein Tcan_02077 [Toxocara canis]|uniref:Uncharacterized protein n=1 Tax=Toxocara canis TaxID=6265 RepID=A0A0B2UQZ4_TOXCA|nr:hypothetical protein Tcan_02077 [Toxocara canis]
MNLQKPVSDFASALLEANEYEAHHFGFSPKAFTDTVFNIVLETWNDVVNDVLYPALVDAGIANLSEERKRVLYLRLANVICKKNMIGVLFKRMEVCSQTFYLLCTSVRLSLLKNVM